MSVTSPRVRALDRVSALVVAVAAALWVSDAYFRPALAKQLTSGEIVLIEDLLISLCLVPLLLVLGRVREIRSLSVRQWAVLAAIAIGPQALATFLFTKGIGSAFGGTVAVNSACYCNAGILREVYLLYLLQPVFGIAFAHVFLGERRKAYYWPLAIAALVGVYLIVDSVAAAQTGNSFDPVALFTSLSSPDITAALYTVGAVILWAAGTVLGRYALTGVSFVTTTAMRFLLALAPLLVLMLIDKGRGFAGFGDYQGAQLPSFLGIALIPGFLAMLLYYRGLAGTPASLATLAELAYPCTLFLVFSLPAPVGQGLPLQPLELVGAVLLVAAVTTLNLLKGRDVVEEPRPHELALAAAPTA